MTILALIGVAAVAVGAFVFLVTYRLLDRFFNPSPERFGGHST